MDNEEKEGGAAIIIVELTGGNITVRHGEDKTILLEKKNIKAGSWEKIWDTLKNL